MLTISDIAGGVGKDTITVFVNGSTGGTNQPRLLMQAPIKQ
jgi:hypothetical protein